MENQEKKQEHEQKEEKMIFLVILTSDGSKTWENSFAKTMKVSELIQKIASQFNLASNGQYELRLQSNLEEPLKPERTLVSYQIEDWSKVIFTDYGKGV